MAWEMNKSLQPLILCHNAILQSRDGVEWEWGEAGDEVLVNKSKDNPNTFLHI